MNKPLSAVMLRRGELLAKIAAQRGQVTELGAHLRAPLALADQGLTAIRFLRSHPALIAGAVALFVIRRRGLPGLVRVGWGVWKGYRFLVRLSKK